MKLKKTIFILLFFPLSIFSQTHFEEVKRIHHNGFFLFDYLQYYSLNTYDNEKIIESFHIVSGSLDHTKYNYISEDTVISISYYMNDKTSWSYLLATTKIFKYYYLQYYVDSVLVCKHLYPNIDLLRESYNEPLPCEEPFFSYHSLLLGYKRSPWKFDFNQVLNLKLDTTYIDTVRTIYRQDGLILEGQYKKNGSFITYKKFSYDENNNLVKKKHNATGITRRKYVNNKIVESSYTLPKDSTASYNYVHKHISKNKILICRLFANGSLLLSSEEIYKEDSLYIETLFYKDSIMYLDEFIDSIPKKYYQNTTTSYYDKNGNIEKKIILKNGLVDKVYTWDYVNDNNLEIEKCYINEELQYTILREKILFLEYPNRFPYKVYK